MTKQVRIARNILVAVLVIVSILWVSDATTPTECKVPVEEMSQFCTDLLFP